MNIQAIHEYDEIELISDDMQDIDVLNAETDIDIVKQLDAENADHILDKDSESPAQTAIYIENITTKPQSIR